MLTSAQGAPVATPVNPILLGPSRVAPLGPLDALSGKQHNFSSIEIGLIGSAHFFGFMIGCFLTPLLISRV